MSSKPLKPCNQIGCNELTRERYCTAHKRAQAEYDKYRGNSNQRGYDSRWRKARLAYLRSKPLCAECEKEGKFEPATELDHIVPHRGNQKLFWSSSNWQGLCKHHHSVKTATEDGGFGNG